jgi:heme/copper-type cytochrome/quinol oxidase subunit 3
MQRVMTDRGSTSSAAACSSSSTGGLCVLVWLALRAQRGDFTPRAHIALELGGLYWHLVDPVWIFLWPLLYLIR